MKQASPSPPPSPGHIEVAREGVSVLLRVVGLGNMNISLTMSDFVDESLRSGFRHFAMDLARCTGMDSTFMGTLVGMSRKIREHKGWLCMLNVSRAHHELLDMVGAVRFMSCKEDFPLVSVETERLNPDRDPARRLTHVRKAHEHLVAIDERNHERFGRFLERLNEEMKDAPGLPEEDADDESFCVDPDAADVDTDGRDVSSREESHAPPEEDGAGGTAEDEGETASSSHGA